MAESGDRTPNQRVNVTLKVSLKYPDKGTFVERFSQNLSHTGIFIRAKDPVPVGSRIRFDYRLSDDSRILRGVGLVRWVRTVEESTEPDHPPGMGIEFVDLDPSTESLVAEIVRSYGEGRHAPRPRNTQPTPVRKAASPAAPESAHATSESATLLDDEERSIIDSLTGSMPVLDAPGLDAAASTSREAEPPPKALRLAAGRLGGAGSAAANDGATLHENVLLLDLCGADFRAAAATIKDTKPPKMRSHLAARLAVSQDGVELLDTGVLYPALASWLGQRWPCPAAMATAKRLGLQLAEAEDGSIGLEGGGRTVPVADALERVLDRLARPYLDDARNPLSLFVVSPASNPEAPVALRPLIARLGVGHFFAVSDVAAHVSQARLRQKDADYTLSVHVTLVETRIALCRGSTTVVAAEAAPEAGLWEADQMLLEHAKNALLRQHRLDVDADRSVREGVRAQIRLSRRKGDLQPWALHVAGTSVQVNRKTLARWADGATERVILQCDRLLRANGLRPSDLKALLVAADESPWPGLFGAIGDVLGVQPMSVRGGAWSRVAGVLQRIKRTGIEGLGSEG